MTILTFSGRIKPGEPITDVKPKRQPVKALLSILKPFFCSHEYAETWRHRGGKVWVYKADICCKCGKQI